MLCTDLPQHELVATVVANDLLVTTLSTLALGDQSLAPSLIMSGRLRALARQSATIRSALGGFDSPMTASQQEAGT